jgi:putative membrane protein
MIHGYSDHAANERTFLAWVRTGIAVIAFGFVIEKFDLFLRTIAASGLGKTTGRLQPQTPGSLAHYDGLAFILVGIALVILATVRFVRTTRLLDDEATHLAKGVRAELILSAVLVVLVASYSIHLALD